MTLEELRTDTYTRSGQLSSNVRQLGLSGIALVWLSQKPLGATTVTIPQELYLAGIFFVLALICDFFQYLYSYSVWYAILCKEEKKGTADNESVEGPTYINYPTNTLWFMKVASVAVGYLFVGLLVAGTIRQ